MATVRISRFGERHGVDWLTYSPLQMRAYHRLSAGDATPVAAALAEVFPDARHVVDVGAGSGVWAAAVARTGRYVEACEHALGGRLYGRWQGVRCVPFDLHRDPPARLRQGFDLAYCFEVAEHLPPYLGDRLVAFLATLAPVVVFTAAPPGAGGLGHINEQPHNYWLERFAQHGSRYCEPTTLELRAAIRRCGVATTWLLDNPMVFRA